MEKIEAPHISRKRVHFSFPQPLRSGQRIIRLDKVSKSYGDLEVYNSLDLEIEKGKHIVLVGPNGAGKSTLLKILAGVLEFNGGERELGHNVQSGYFAQHRTEVLQSNRTVLEEMLDTSAQVTEESVRTLLGCFLFSEDDVFKKVGVLSGGEKSRLAMAKLLLNPPNFLLLDEPTTHLDMASIDTLIDATLATPYNVRPIDYGVDFVLHSATKYLGGHNDLLAGVIVGPSDKMESVRNLRGIMGGINSPHNIYLLARGLKTFALRVQRHNENGQAIAEFLESHQLCGPELSQSRAP